MKIKEAEHYNNYNPNKRANEKINKMNMRKETR